MQEQVLLRCSGRLQECCMACAGGRLLQVMLLSAARGIQQKLVLGIGLFRRQEQLMMGGRCGGFFLQMSLRCPSRGGQEMMGGPRGNREQQMRMRRGRSLREQVVGAGRAGH